MIQRLIVGATREDCYEILWLKYKGFNAGQPANTMTTYPVTKLTSNLYSYFGYINQALQIALHKLLLHQHYICTGIGISKNRISTTEK